uniref:Uncharacterized protein n=1 Tax=Strombidium inclinatum TaxID=197538 RepID=A0A7S3N2L4_9SPIT|mmetsp:Transcript_42357/g.64999  ORF Transcript_42357/g.64999 Transcript_42357/m.64999 type:complete len:176 (+) Transcript_42357:277-804(+)|eukprot:CAMPEP_0170492954 /NCGR_PEP_ID=MMETSP0208-20121228/13131_1 /TAXON_ID=197538 /ORGANISM="Strombidium inclinatum, Strain S3" /LENGTH=175 /DNA_ID=CAMNT_0010768797 /DNA_START=277 /DNA_END=804 /DNA_ORIENTATION=+
MDTGFLKILHLVAETFGIKVENDIDFFQVGDDKTQEVVYTYDQYFIFNNVYIDAILGVLYALMFHHFVYLWSNLAFDYFYVAEAKALSCIVIASFVLMGAYFFLPFAMWYFQGQFYEGMDSVLDTFSLIHDKEDILTGMTVLRTVLNLVMLGTVGRGAYILNSSIFGLSIPQSTV